MEAYQGIMITFFAILLPFYYFGSLWTLAGIPTLHHRLWAILIFSIASSAFVYMFTRAEPYHLFATSLA
jgi:hypothetical protein